MSEYQKVSKQRMPKLFSYVVDHDHGFAPNPCDGFCTLAKCKFGKKNITELAQKGDWIVGTGGANLKKSAGHGNLIYAMKVDDKIPLAEYCHAYGGKRIDADHVENEDDRSVLTSNHFFYFGRNAIPIPKRFGEDFEKRGRGYRSNFTDELVEKFAKWLEANFTIGVNGAPCKPHPDIRIRLSCESKSKQKRKGCAK